MTGKGRNRDKLYLIDFGLTQKETQLEPGFLVDKEIFELKNLNLKGTPDFASINAHLGWNSVFKKDDIESLVYLLVYLANGSLPWSGVKINKNDNHSGILQSKMSVTPTEL